MTTQRPARFKPRRWHAAFFARLVGNEPPRFRALRRRAVSGAAGRVLEIGAGVGANFAYYRAVDSVLATEPDPHMLRRARAAAAATGGRVDLLQAAAEALPLPDRSVDTVLCVLVLCTVQDPARALAELRRVLRPGGTLRFMEHVRGGSIAGVAHDVIAPVWRHFVGGCSPNRRTEVAIEAAGFRIVAHERRAMAPDTPLVIGAAVPR